MTFPSIDSLTISGVNQIVSTFNRLTKQLQILSNYLNGKPQLDSLVITNITLVAGNNQISHTLGKVLTGWMVIDITTPSLIGRYAPSNSTTLFLTSSVATTVSLEVY